MFGSALYDPKAAWRNEPPSAGQLRLLTELEVAPPPSMTKGQASDLISRSREPDDEQIEFLKFFDIKLSKSATQLEANHRIADIVSDPANKAKWDARPATAEQKEIIRHVDGKAPTGITLMTADKLIRSYFKDEAKNHKYEEITAILDERQAVEDAKEDRLSLFRDHCENLNQEPSRYGLKRTGIRLVSQAIEEWECEASTKLEQLEIDTYFMDRLAERIRKIDPTKATKEAINHPQLFRAWEPAKSHANHHGGSLLLAFVGAIVLLVLLSRCSA